ncbi:MAG: hypothetical protein QXY40_08035 [Candidatus Methanomethylicia archaeon]
MPKKKVNPEELLRFMSEGRKLSEIARYFETSIQDLYYWLRKLGLKKREGVEEILPPPPPPPCSGARFEGYSLSKQPLFKCPQYNIKLSINGTLCLDCSLREKAN